MDVPINSSLPALGILVKATVLKLITLTPLEASVEEYPQVCEQMAACEVPGAAIRKYAKWP